LIVEKVQIRDCTGSDVHHIVTVHANIALARRRTTKTPIAKMILSSVLKLPTGRSGDASFTTGIGAGAELIDEGSPATAVPASGSGAEAVRAIGMAKLVGDTWSAKARAKSKQLANR
jgi:hypothetical protein